MADDTQRSRNGAQVLLARRIAREAITAAVLVAAYLGAYLIRFEFRVPEAFWRTALLTLPFVVLGKLLLLRALRAHQRSWRYTSLWDVVAITQTMLAASLILAGLRLLGAEVLRWQGLSVVVVPLGVIAADLALSLVGLVGVRALRRLQHEEVELRRRRRGGVTRPRSTVLLFGAGRVGSQVAREILTRPDLGLRVVGFLDDDPAKRRQVIQGVEVLGTREDLAEVVASRQVDQVVITLADPSAAVVRELTERCRAARVEHRILPRMDDLLAGEVRLAAVRPARIEDLLRRDPVELDLSAIGEIVAGRTVMVTGAGGSIGAELGRQLLRFSPARIVLVERSEPALWAVQRELAALAVSLADQDTAAVVPALADVTNASRVDALIAAERPAVVFHAAAHKHVPMLEEHPGEAVRNNVLGTKVVADACARQDVERFVLVSTDKAVNPSSIMGATKRVAERYVQHLAATTGRIFVSVRFGNVLGSTGSVVPIFEAQIAAGGPVTVTHPEMTRYFMTIPEASQLVIQAAALGTGGEVFLLDMGEPVRIVDLARDLIRLSGFEPDRQIAIEFTGVRPGEKLFEDLSLDHERHEPTSHPAIVVMRDGRQPRPGIDAEVAALIAAVEAAPPQVRAVLQTQIPSLPAAQPAERSEPPSATVMPGLSVTPRGVTPGATRPAASTAGLAASPMDAAVSAASQGSVSDVPQRPDVVGPSSVPGQQTNPD